MCFVWADGPSGTYTKYFFEFWLQNVVQKKFIVVERSFELYLGVAFNVCVFM